MASAPKKTPCGQRPCTNAEKDFLTLLGLPEDANDNEVIQQLDILGTQPLAMGVIVRRKMYSAVPKLLQIVNDPNALAPSKLSAARTLCFLGNKEWMPTIKALSTDPNSIASRTPLKIKFAGLLARGGDYSQFEIIAAAIGDSRKFVRGWAIYELTTLRHKSNPVTDSAVELLLSVANADPDLWLRQSAMDSLEKIAKEKPQIKPRLKVSDSTVELLVSVANTDLDPWLRQKAIWSLWKIAQKKPQTKPRLIDALVANKNSRDKNLRRVCRMWLKVYTPNRNK